MEGYTNTCQGNTAKLDFEGIHESIRENNKRRFLTLHGRWTNLQSVQ